MGFIYGDILGREYYIEHHPYAKLQNYPHFCWEIICVGNCDINEINRLLVGVKVTSSRKKEQTQKLKE